jgi:hypothetical protein
MPAGVRPPRAVLVDRPLWLVLEVLLSRSMRGRIIIVDGQLCHGGLTGQQYNHQKTGGTILPIRNSHDIPDPTFIGVNDKR